MTIGKKDIYRWIDKNADILPPDEYFAFHKYYPGSHFNEDEKELIGQWEEHPVNHKRRLKRIWRRTHDFLMINKYFEKYGSKLSIIP